MKIFALTAPEVLFIDDIQELSRANNNYFLISNSVRDGFLDIIPQNDLQGLLECDSKAIIKQKKYVKKNRNKVLRTKTLSGKSLSFTLNKKVQIKFPTKVNECLLSVWEQSSPEEKATIKLIKDQNKFPFLKSLNHVKEKCNYSRPSSELNIDKLFMSNDWPMMTCAHEVEKVEILNNSKESFLSKIEALLGQRPDLSFINNQNPYAELDFSHAPKLKAIFLSSLLYRKDFSGVVLARLLKFHAKRGTLVNIIATGYMHNEKDKSLLKELTNYSGNIRVQEYKYHTDNIIQFPTQYAVDHFRNLHMKMLITLGDRQKDNILITGGRNVHDGFLFSEKPDLSLYPELDQLSKDESYAYWQDLEIKITSNALARSVYSHLLKFWNRKIINESIEDIKSPERTPIIESQDMISNDKIMMRHFISVPFKDDHALESLYVEMIDKATSSIQLSTPYLRPTKAIMSAFERAIERGVDIAIQTRINLEGDTQAWLYEETNKAAINALYNKVKLYEWKEKSILHTKLIIIDKSLTFFGSVNLSRRSFIQDIEQGLLIRNKKMANKFSDLFDHYNSMSRRITKKESRKLWATIIINLIPNQF